MHFAEAETVGRTFTACDDFEVDTETTCLINSAELPQLLPREPCKRLEGIGGCVTIPGQSYGATIWDRPLYNKAKEKNLQNKQTPINLLPKDATSVHFFARRWGWPRRLRTNNGLRVVSFIKHREVTTVIAWTRARSLKQTL